MKKALKIIAIIIGVSIILAIVSFILTAVFTLSGIGNPITNLRAKSAINEYVEANYPDNDFEDIRVTYNFKFGGYGAQLVSESSMDTRFYVSYDRGEIEDSFDDYVTSGRNTYNRLQQEYNDYVDELMEKTYPNEIELSLFDLYSTACKADPMGIVCENVELDGSLDITQLDDLGLSPSVVVWFYTEDISFEYIADKFIEVKNLLNSRGIYPAEFSISLCLPEEHEDKYSESLSIHDFPTELIGADNFMGKLAEYNEQGLMTKEVEYDE